MLRLLAEHWELKLISVIVAFTLWFFVTTTVRSPVGFASGPSPVVPEVRGAPASGYAVQRVVVEPPSVMIRGPRSTIETRGEVSTLPVDVSGRRATVTQSVGLLPPASTYLTHERTARVTVEIAEDGVSQPSQGSRKKGSAR